MTLTFVALSVAAGSVGFIHTVAGPDHYLPFVVMARARNWSGRKTAAITFLCGLGHIASSVILGLIGIALGVALTGLGGSNSAYEAYELLPDWMKSAEGIRGGIAAWLLIVFGLLYFAWGLRRAIRNRPHTHRHFHAGGTNHEHDHSHDGGHVHPHEANGKRLTPWILFTIFVFGPCEPLIPLVIAGAMLGPWTAAAVTLIFGGITIATMLGIVMLGTFGLKLFPTRLLDRYSHALAGATICLCGVGIVFLGM